MQHQRLQQVQEPRQRSTRASRSSTSSTCSTLVGRRAPRPSSPTRHRSSAFTFEACSDACTVNGAWPTSGGRSAPSPRARRPHAPAPGEGQPGGPPATWPTPPSSTRTRPRRSRSRSPVRRSRPTRSSTTTPRHRCPTWPVPVVRCRCRWRGPSASSPSASPPSVDGSATSSDLPSLTDSSVPIGPGVTRGRSLGSALDVPTIAPRDPRPGPPDPRRVPAAAGRLVRRGRPPSCTWWAGSCATCCWAGRSERRRPRPHHRRPPRGDPGAGRRVGRRRVGPGRPVRHHRRAPGRPHPARSRPTGPRRTRPDSRKPEVVYSDAVEADLARRATSPSTPWPSPCRWRPTPSPRWSTRSTAWPTSSSSAGSARRSTPEESFSDDPLRMLRAARFIAGYGLAAGPEGWWRRPRPWPTAWRSSRPSGCVTSSTKLLVVDDPGRRPVVPARTPGCSPSLLPEIPAMRLEQDPIHRHKDVLTHTIAVVGNVRPRTRRRAHPTTSRGWPPCSTTSASPGPAATGPRASCSTTTRWSGPGWPGSGWWP